MSRFTTLVITDLKVVKSKKVFLKKVTDLLSAYSDFALVPEYERECDCIGEIVYEEVEQKSSNRFGDWEELEDKFDIVSKYVSWEDFSRKKREYENALIEKHPLRNKPDKHCEFCNGKGTYKSTQNHNGKWDVFKISGLNETKYIFKAKEFLEIPFAVLTPDGKWHEEKKIGRLGSVLDYDKSWNKRCRRFIKKYGENYSALIHCHR